MTITTQMRMNNGVPVAGEYALLGGCALQALLPHGFTGAWTREQHEALDSSNTRYLEENQAVPDSRKGLFDYQMGLIFAIPGISSVEVHVDGHEHTVQIVTHFDDEQTLPLSVEEIDDRIMRALLVFNDARF